MCDFSDLHPFLEELKWLHGSWITQDGQGQYPTIEPFTYGEQLNFLCVGQPMYVFSSESWHPKTKRKMHMGQGFLRVKPDTRDISFLLSHNFGLTSIEEGTYAENEITLNSTQVARMQFAKNPAVTKLKREITLMNPDTLQIVTFMETEKTPMTEHLRATYKKKN